MEHPKSDESLADELAELSKNDTWDLEAKLWTDQAMNIYFYIEEAMISLVGILTIIFAILGIFCVWKCKKMQNKLNIMLCSVMMSGIFIQLTAFQTMVIFYTIFNINVYHTYCIWHGSLPTFICAEAAVALMISVDWVVVRMQDKVFKISLVVIWVLAIAYILINGIMCMVELGPIDWIFAYVIIFSHALLLLKSLWYLVQTLRKKATKDQHYRNAIVGYYLLSIVLALFGRHAHYMFSESLLSIPIRIFTLSYYCHILIIIYVVTRYDENFKVFFANVFHCKWHYIQATFDNQQDADDRNDLMNVAALEDVSAPTAAEDNPITTSETNEREDNANCRKTTP